MRGLLTAVVRDMMMENDILPVTKKGTCARLRIWCRKTCRFESYQAHERSILLKFNKILDFLYLQCNYCNSITNLGKSRKKRLLL